MDIEPANDVDDSAEDEREDEIERLGEILWNVARSTNSAPYLNCFEHMKLPHPEQAVGDWLRRLREKRGAAFAAEVHARAATWGEFVIEQIEEQATEAKRGQALLERPASHLMRSLLQVAKPEN